MPLLDADPDRLWFVMPLADGSLDRLWLNGSLGSDPELVAQQVVEDASRGLEHAHGEGLTHRDVSPMNILQLSSPFKRWVVSDWGLVKRPTGQTTRRLTSTNEGLGTRGFAAPETWSNAHKVDERADVYSLGRVVAWLLTGDWPQQNVELLPVGRLRGLVYEATRHAASRRIESMGSVRERLATLFEAMPISPRATVRELVERGDLGDKDVTRAIDLALANDDDDELFLDELARLPDDAVAKFTEAHPDDANSAASAMLRFLLEGRFGDRDFAVLDDPLGFAFTVLRNLVETGHQGSEDLAVDFFRAESHWDQWKQLRSTVAWLCQLRDPSGQTIARAMRRAGEQTYYAKALGHRRLLSHALAAELGR
jgi:serine/threonine protein kinase